MMVAQDLLFNRGRIAPERRVSEITAVALALLGVALLGAGMTDAGPSTYLLNLIGQVATFGMLAISLDLIWGFAGVLSLGHGLFFAIGGYVIAMHMVKIRYQATGTPPDFMLFMGWEALPQYYWGLESFSYAVALALALAAVVAFVLGYMAFRSRVAGVYFAILTQAFVYVAMLLMFRNDTGFGGNNGMTGFSELLDHPLADRRTVASLSAISILLVASMLAISARIVTSRFGNMLVAIRDDEARLRFLGHETLWIKLSIWSLSAVMAALAGILYVPQVGIINPRVLAPDLSIEIAVWVAIGGRGTLTGAFLGAVLVSSLKFVLTAMAPDLWPFILSGLVLLVAVLLPNGLTDLSAVLAARFKGMVR